MPSYVYKSKDHPGVKACPCWWPGYVVKQSMADDPLTECPACFAPVYRSIQRVKLNVRKLARDVHGGPDYREDHARFKGDPEAWVDGPRSLQKLMDARKRDGWQMSRDLSVYHDTDCASATGAATPEQDEALKHEAYEEARAGGFSLQDPDVQAFLDDATED